MITLENNRQSVTSSLIMLPEEIENNYIKVALMRLQQGPINFLSVGTKFYVVLNLIT